MIGMRNVLILIIEGKDRGLEILFALYSDTISKDGVVRRNVKEAQISIDLVLHCMKLNRFIDDYRSETLSNTDENKTFYYTTFKGEESELFSVQVSDNLVRVKNTVTEKMQYYKNY